MREWLDAAAHIGPEVSLRDTALRLALSFLLGGVVAGIYAITQRRSRVELSRFATTIVLLTILIAMVTLVIRDNVARAFSLAGALAIIRFRTIVEDTRDTAFVIFAVVVGMSIGTGSIWIALIGTPIVAGAALLLSLLGRGSEPAAGNYSLAVRLSLGRDPGIFKSIFDKHLTQVRLIATATARQGAALDLTYVVGLRRNNDAVAFVSELNQVEGVQNVDLRQV